MARTIGALFTEARGLLNDSVQTGSPSGYRFSDADLMAAFNDALIQARAKRPDLFLDMGLRSAVPMYDASVDLGVAFPLDATVYPAFLFYIVGRSELREDTFTDDGRAVTLMNKFVSQLTQVVS